MYFSEEIKLYFGVQLAPLFLSCTLAIMKFIFLNFFGQGFGFSTQLGNKY